MNNDIFNLIFTKQGLCTSIRKLNLYLLLSGIVECNIPGDIVEMGTYQGHTAILMQYILDYFSSQKTIYVFDSFSGLPAPSECDKPLDGSKMLVEKSLCATKEQVIQNFRARKLKEPVIYKGFFDAIPQDCFPEKICFAHLDGDFYHSIKTSLECIVDRLEFNSIVLADDYGWSTLPGVKKAVDEFVQSLNLQIHSLRTDAPTPKNDFQGYFRYRPYKIL